MENISYPKLMAKASCSKKEESEDGFTIIFGEPNDETYFKLFVEDKDHADIFLVGREYKISFKLSNEEALTKSHLYKIHPELSTNEVKSLLEYSKENKIFTVMSYEGSVSNIYPMWKEEVQSKLNSEQNVE